MKKELSAALLGPERSLIWPNF